jgi:hypothetical protein
LKKRKTQNHKSQINQSIHTIHREEKENVNNKNNNNRKKQQKETTERNNRTVSIDRGTARDSYNTLPSFARVSSPWSPEFNSIDVPSCQFNLAFFRFLGQEDGATVPPPSPSFEPDRTLQGFHGRVPFRGVVGEQEFCALGGVLVLWGPAASAQLRGDGVAAKAGADELVRRGGRR